MVVQIKPGQPGLCLANTSILDGKAMGGLDKSTMRINQTSWTGAGLALSLVILHYSGMLDDIL